MATGQLIFQPPMFDWQAEDQQHTFEESKGQVTLALRASSIRKDIWFAIIVDFLGKEGFRWWNTLPISMDEQSQKNPEAVFKAFAETLEVSTSYCNHLMRCTVTSNGRARDNQPTRLTHKRHSQMVPVPLQR